ncbi:MAG TPA: hypothetical protein VKZ48_07075 [Burkholderiales bacterium]|nr:hypothetical protein [Burkholderiales bacterium]
MNDRREQLTPRLAALALTVALLAGAAIATLKGAWWTAVGFGLAWLLLQCVPPVWQRLRMRR